jgi:hypothetical protein
VQANNESRLMAELVIPGMPTRSPRTQLFEWRVVRIRSFPAAIIGYFKAANADEAIKQAIAEREISDPTTLSRLAAQKVREVGETVESVFYGR